MEDRKNLKYKGVSRSRRTDLERFDDDQELLKKTDMELEQGLITRND